jgi:LL-diaminopimelate aminotransferase
MQVEAQINSYMAQAKTLREGLEKMGHSCVGGIDSPYIWWKAPKGVSSWDFFDQLLGRHALVSVPGKGFGAQGEGYVRLSAFTTEENAHEALKRIEHL